jgi:polysaccharide pyruvyl transferase WcaK-like protein
MSYVEKLLGRVPDHVRLTPDIAFEFQSAPSATGEKLIRSLGIGGKGIPLLGIAPNMRVFERMPGSGQENRYVQLMVEVVRWARSVGASVLLIPHEISFAKNPQDDRFLCRLIKDAIGDGGEVAVLDGLYSAADVKAVVGNLDMLVGSRFHSIVAALSCRVPPIVLGWSHKYLELMRSVGLEDLVLDYAQPETSVLIERIDMAWRGRRELQEQLQARVPAVEAEVDRVFDLVAGLIQGSSS